MQNNEIKYNPRDLRGWDGEREEDWPETLRSTGGRKPYKGRMVARKEWESEKTEFEFHFPHLRM